MNILQMHGTATKFGGASNGTKILCKEHSSLGHSVFLIYNLNNQVLDEFDFKKKLAIDFSTFNIFKFLKNYFRILKVIKKENIDLIHSHHRNDTIYSALVKLLRPNIFLVYTVHGVQVVNNEDRFKYRVLRLIYFKLINVFFHKIIYISKYSRDLTKKYFHKVRHHIVIHNGTPAPALNGDGFGMSKIEEEIKRAFSISLIGDVGGVKRPQIVLDLANRLKDSQNIKFFVIGDGEQKAQLIEDVKNLDLTNVFFVESTPLIGPYIDSSNIIISLSVEEGFGRTIIEAMSLGKPVIAFDSGGPKEIIDNGVNGFLIPVDDIRLFSEKILELYNDPNFAKKMGKAGFRIYRDRFSEKVYAKKHIKEFESVFY